MTYRETAGLTLERLAEQTGLTVQALDQFEHGWLDLPIISIATIAEALNAKLSDLLDVGWTELGIAADQAAHTPP